MYVERLNLTDFRNYREVEITPAPEGITVVTGANGEGKTNLLEAIAYLATLRSMRGSPPSGLVREGSAPPVAVVRAVCNREGRRVAIDAEVHPAGRDRVLVNGQALRRTRDLTDALVVTVFSPDDPSLVKAGPQGRREYLDALLASVHPRHGATLGEVERVLRQRNALLRSAAPWSGRPIPPEVASTLDVWDAKLASCGETLAESRRALVEGLGPAVSGAYAEMAGIAHAGVALTYRRSWEGDLAAALADARRDDLRRGVTTAGPHRDELHMSIGGLPARTHASQGEQRTLALALRLGGHRLVTEAAGTSPVLLLDDVFSELDSYRCDALVASLPDGQAILTTAGETPPGAGVSARYRVEGGKVLQ
jgi:DNA replication and repair protein RecF